MASLLLPKSLHHIRSGEPAKSRVFAAVRCGKFPATGKMFDSPRRNAMNAHEVPTIEDWKTLIEAEYREMPGLTLTKPQVRRLWHLEPQVCDAILKELVSSDFLEHTRNDVYVLSSSRRH